jgi:tetratricopeptide (TPR) repeat protein
MKKNSLNMSGIRLAAGLCAVIAAITLLAGSFETVFALETGTLRKFKRGDKLLPIRLMPVDGSAPMSFTPGNGKPTVIMFFTVRPDFRKKRSLALLSTLSDLAETYKSRINVFGIYSDNQKIDEVKKYMDTSALRIKIYDDKDKKIYNDYGVFMMPLVVISDIDGTLHEIIPYTYSIREIIEGNIKLLLGEWDKTQLVRSLKPKENKIISSNEKEYIRRINYGRLMHSKKMCDQAVREFSNAITLMPESIMAYNELGFVFITMQQYKKAEGSFRSALGIDQDSDDAISGLGLALHGQGNIDDAFPSLEQAFISQEPRLDVIIALAEIYEQKGFNKKAIRLHKLVISRLMTMYEQRWK